MIKKFSKLLLGLLVFNTLCSPIFAIVHANERSVPSEEIILNTWADEFEYIFTELYTKTSSGYILNSHKMATSGYTYQEQQNIITFVSYLQNTANSKPENWYSEQIRPLYDVDGCISKTLGISRTVAKEILNHTRKGNYLAAVGALTTALKAAGLISKFPKISIALLVGYLIICGEETVS